MSNYQCNVCQHIYDSAVGDKRSGIAAGTSFEELPESWECPICGVGKESFHLLEEEVEAAEADGVC